MIRARLLSVTVMLAALTGLLTVAAPALADPSPPAGTPTAATATASATVGPLFRGGLNGSHGCTASVVASPAGDLALTAAHCVWGTAAGWLFAPGYDQGRTPYRVWTVAHVYLDPHWTASQDPQYDYAILQLAPQEIGGRSVSVQAVTGANTLTLAPAVGTDITDVAYNQGQNDQPITCTVPVSYTAGYPTFNCHGYVGGSSGSPWLITTTHGTEVAGVIGGLHQGGCYEFTSYSPVFTPAIQALLARAETGTDPDTAPDPGSDGCA